MMTNDDDCGGDTQRFEHSNALLSVFYFYRAHVIYIRPFFYRELPKPIDEAISD